jgi:hypothetical protein
MFAPVRSSRFLLPAGFRWKLLNTTQLPVKLLHTTLYGKPRIVEVMRQTVSKSSQPDPFSARFSFFLEPFSHSARPLICPCNALSSKKRIGEHRGNQ